jgi:SAM-dependent methyltransferase
VTSAGYDPTLFARLADVEDRSFWYRERNRLIVSTLRRFFPDATSLLEVGCGAGGVLVALRAELPELRLVGTDLFAEGLELAHARVPDVELVQADARELQYAEEFDVVGAFDVLEHVDRDDLVLASMYRAARPRRGAMILVPQHPRVWSEMDTIAHHERRYSRRELVSKARAAGFGVELVTSFVATLLPAMVLSRLPRRLLRRPYDPVRELAPGALNPLFERILGGERRLIDRGVSLPFGASLLLVARKPGLP